VRKSFNIIDRVARVITAAEPRHPAGNLPEGCWRLRQVKNQPYMVGRFANHCLTKLVVGGLLNLKLANDNISAELLPCARRFKNGLADCDLSAVHTDTWPPQKRLESTEQRSSEWRSSEWRVHFA
jgi:hypothetical protein